MASTALKSLYARIPKVEGCRTNCSDCCGVVPMIAEEADAVPVMIAARPGGTEGHRYTPFNHCGTCEYASPAGCMIYEHRPFMCRLFAAVADEPRLTCPHGAKADNPLTPDETLAALKIQQMEAQAKAELEAARFSALDITADTTLQAAMAMYAHARHRAGLSPLPTRRIREIAKGKIALARDFEKNGKRRQRLGRRANYQPISPPPARTREVAAPSATTVQDQLEAALWTPGCSAFWLDPDRWHGVPMGADGRLDAFWLHLDKRAPPAKRKARTLSGSSTGWDSGGCPPPPPPSSCTIKPRYRIDDLGRLYLVAPKEAGGD